MRTILNRVTTVLCASAIALTAFASTPAHANSTPEPRPTASLQPVASFGSNPGALAMYAYIPDTVAATPAVVVAAHGCAQDAAAYHGHSGWQRYADEWGFIVVYPQQPMSNNFNKCFNWFEPADQGRSGEAASIASMVGHAVTTWGADPSRVYVTGLSAGGAMSAIMLAAYPELFAGGSIIGGIPYRCATSSISAFSCMNPGTDRTPAAWGDLVRAANTGYDGPRAKVAIWHGGADYVVATRNGAESRDQWTNVHGVAATPTETVALPANTTLDKYGTDDVRVYTVAGMGHGTPVDPGTGPDQCGTAGAYFLDTICSTYHDAVYFGLNG